VQKTIRLKSDEEALKLFGHLDAHITYAEENFHVAIVARKHKLTISGTAKNIAATEAFFQSILNSVRRGEHIAPDFLSRYSAKRSAEETPVRARVKEKNGSFFVTNKGTGICARSDGQKEYIEAAQKHDIVFCIGPAGTGKTYLAVAIALTFLKQKKVERILLTRPAVEAGESLGYLPGDMYAKLNPYLRPLYDALYEMIGFEEVARSIECGVIEIAPLAYMRGRTLNDSFIILDEAQNATPQQMQMFLTRLGFSSKCIITGDITQIDLPFKTTSGLIDVQTLLPDIDGIDFIYLDEHDVVRHQLVKEIIRAYEKKEKRRKKSS
jgi:phosphate starvation-inducible protein PhoH and related proteins